METSLPPLDDGRGVVVKKVEDKGVGGRNHSRSSLLIFGGTAPAEKSSKLSKYLKNFLPKMTIS